MATGGRHAGLVLLALALGLAGCVSPSAQGGPSVIPGPGQPRTLVMALNIEAKNLSPKVLGDTNPARTTRIFNAGLTLIDPQDNARPYLAESLPQLNTDTWHVFPDGRMETTWKLRPGLTWHDGEPLTAEDFVFAVQVYKAPDLTGNFFGPRPQDIIERAVAVDPRTVRLYWRSPFLHTGGGVEPLPRLYLSEPFAAFERDPLVQREAFIGLRYWTTEYVGAGPFKLTNWEPASYVQGEAFDGHALGRPKIDRVVVRFINDENAVVANIMAGEVHLTMAQALRFEGSTVLRDHGGFNDAERKGAILLKADSTATAMPQHRPEYQQTSALLDVRVRRALAHASDRNAINDGIYEGQTQVPVPNSWANPDASYYAEVDRAITKYSYDPRRTEQLMGEAGYSRDRDGFFLDSTGQRFQPALWHTGGAQKEKVLAIVADTWQRAGINAQPVILPNALERDQQARATYSGIFINSLGLGEASSLNAFTSESIGTSASRWQGSNRGGWAEPGYDLLWDRYNRTLDRGEQIQAFVQAMKLHSEQVPYFPLHYSLNPVTHLSVLKGPDGDSSHWNIHEWELTS